MLVRVARRLEADDRGARCDVTYVDVSIPLGIRGSGKGRTTRELHEGTAFGVLDRVNGVFSDLGDNPELGGDPVVVKLALGIALDLGIWETVSTPSRGPRRLEERVLFALEPTRREWASGWVIPECQFVQED